MSCAEVYKQISSELETVSRQSGYGRIKVLAVTKNQPAEKIMELYEAGVREFAENRIAVLEEKMEKLPSDIVWHFIGKIQSNKVRKVIKAAQVLHSIDSMELLRRMERICSEERIFPELFLEVNISGESSKSGVTLSEAEKILSTELSGVKITGLMTMAPNGADEEELTSIFSGLRSLGESYGIKEYSMGMSNDCRTAAQCGATIVRIGTALFT